MLSIDTDQNTKESARSENEEGRDPSPYLHIVLYIQENTAEMHSLGNL